MFSAIPAPPATCKDPDVELVDPVVSVVFIIPFDVISSELIVPANVTLVSLNVAAVVVPDFITMTDGGIPIFHITPRYYTSGIMRGWNNDGVPFISFKYKVQGGLDFIGGEDGDNVEKDKYGIEIIFVSSKNGVLNSCGSRRSIYRSSFVGGHIDGEAEADGPGFNWYPGGNMEFAIDRPYDINWRALRFRLFTPYCIDYIRRLVYGKELWDVIEIRGEYKEGIGGIGGAGKLVLCGSDL